jgi:hypothetical protein
MPSPGCSGPRTCCRGGAASTSIVRRRARRDADRLGSPKSKPLRLVEFGCGAVDKGANAPNLFVDAKSAESALPPFSDGTRDEVGQRRALEAVLAHLADPATNPVSPLYGGPMIEGAAAWCWDARPFPDFPARSAVWADGPNWTLGHWLNGRAGIAPLPELVAALAQRAGATIDPGEAGGAVVGYVVDRPMRLRDALAPLLEAFALDPVERQDGVALAGRSGAAALTLGDDDLAWPEDRAAPLATARTLAAPVQALRLRFIDAARDYQTGSVIVRREGGPNPGEGAPTSTRRWCWPPPTPGPWPSACWPPPIRARPPSTCRPWPPCAWSPGIGWRWTARPGG